MQTHNDKCWSWRGHEACARARVAELERDHSALMDAYKEMSDRAFAAEERVAELERLRTEKQIIHARTVDAKDAEIERLRDALLNIESSDPRDHAYCVGTARTALENTDGH